MIEIIKAIIFGIVEGITEWLPVSSTGHMIILDSILKLNVTEEFYEMFEVVIQLGAIVAVILTYFKLIFPWGFGKDKKETNKTFNLWGKILVACVPAAVIGILFDDILDKYLYTPLVVAIALIIYGVVFILIENKNIGTRDTKNIDDITYSQAFKIGLFQLLALIPGTSRSGSTIIGGLLTGLERSVIVQFTFLVAIPVMAGASLLKILKYVMKVGLVFTSTELTILLVGCVVAFIVSLFVIKLMMNYIKDHDIKPFGYYRIVLGILVILLYLTKII